MSVIFPSYLINGLRGQDQSNKLLTKIHVCVTQYATVVKLRLSMISCHTTP